MAVTLVPVTMVESTANANIVTIPVLTKVSESLTDNASETAVMHVNAAMVKSLVLADIAQTVVPIKANEFLTDKNSKMAVILVPVTMAESTANDKPATTVVDSTEEPTKMVNDGQSMAATLATAPTEKQPVVDDNPTSQLLPKTSPCNFLIQKSIKNPNLHHSPLKRILFTCVVLSMI